MGNLLTQLRDHLARRPIRGVAAAAPAVGQPSSKSEPDFDHTTDLELIERFAHAWPANAGSYREMLSALRKAAWRLLPLCTTDGRVQKVQEEIICLARQPLFFPEMFHAARLMPDGTFGPLEHADAILLRATGLIGPDDRTALREIYQRLLETSNGPLRVVEIGSAAGRGSTRIAGEFVKRSGGVLYCIDPWLGSRYFGFLANMRVLDLEGTILPIRSGSTEAARLFDDGSLDGVFIDGSHYHPQVVADIDAYLPKVRKNGIVFGHDLNDVPSRFDRHELLSLSRPEINNIEVTYRNAKGEIERIDGHPGVILAVQDRFGDDVELFPGSVVWAKQI